ncbi:MAG TPA: hypothetical protein VKX17_10330 [Planctomycetota bacterium]|nr:hypothetical protein [Planctomycetota bacterium]
MQNEELDNLISAFLNGEIDAAGREKLSRMLESDPAAMEALDQALRMEALLRAAHTDASAEQAAAEKIARRLKDTSRDREGAGQDIASQPAPLRSRLAGRVIRNGSFRNRNPFDQRKVSQAPAWITVAALIAVMFGLAFYYKYSGPAKPEVAINDKPGETSRSFTVANGGRVLVDGKEKTQVAENDWVTVHSDAPAVLKAGDGTSVTLQPGSSALLRKRGATLLNGSARFTVPSGKDLYILDTTNAALKLYSEGGDFQVGLQPTGSGSLALTVSVISGSARVDEAGTSTQLKAGQSQGFGYESVTPSDKIANDNTGNKTETPRQKPPPHPFEPEFASILLTKKYIDGLKLTEDQQAQLRAMQEKVAKHQVLFYKDPEAIALMEQQRNYEPGTPEFHDIQRKIHDRQLEMTRNDKAGDPRDVLLGDQHRKLEELLQGERGTRAPSDGGRDGPEPPPKRPPPPPLNDGPPDQRPPRPPLGGEPPLFPPPFPPGDKPRPKPE